MLKVSEQAQHHQAQESHLVTFEENRYTGLGPVESPPGAPASVVDLALQRSSKEGSRNRLALRFLFVMVDR
jgi:hypothetical protein